jgi:hypothetical protein
MEAKVEVPSGVPGSAQPSSLLLELERLMEQGEMRMELDSSPSSSPAETKVEAEAWEPIPSFSCSEDEVGDLKLRTTIGVPPGFRNLGEEPRVLSPLQDEANWHKEERMHHD